MSDPAEIQRIGQMIDEYYARVDPIDRRGVASSKPSDRGVPPEMWAGPVSPDGWVDWKLLPSTLTSADVLTLESEFADAFPPSFQAYPQARFHCFDRCKAYGTMSLSCFRPYPRAIRFAGSANCSRRGTC